MPASDVVTGSAPIITSGLDLWELIKWTTKDGRRYVGILMTLIPSHQTSFHVVRGENGDSFIIEITQGESVINPQYLINVESVRMGFNDPETNAIIRHYFEKPPKIL